MRTLRIFVLLCGIGCVWSGHALIGGVEVGPSDAILEHFVALAVTYDGRGRYDACSGVLISDHHVLTAGHCLTSTYRRDPANVRVLAFRDARQIKASLRVRKYDVNPDFLSGVVGSDLAVVTLADPLPAGSAPIALATDPVRAARLAPVEVAGVGLTDFRRPSSEWLVKRGRLAYGHSAGAESWLRRGRDGVPCSGDSGGPAYVVDPVTKRTALVGIQTDYTFDGATRLMTGAMIVHPSSYAEWLARALAPEAGEYARGVRAEN